MTAADTTDELRIAYYRLDEVLRWPRNPKLHDIGALVESIRRHWMVDPPSPCWRSRAGR